LWKKKKRKKPLDVCRIYTIQNRGEAFNTVGELLNAMSENFPKFLNTSARKGFEEAGFSPLVIDELIAATTQVNYGQAPSEIHKFVGKFIVNFIYLTPSAISRN